MKNTIITILVLLALVGGIYYFTKNTPEPTQNTNEPVATTTPVTQTPQTDKTKTVIGKSVSGKDIVAYHYGTGSKEVVFVGGIHGGYSWNTSLLAYEIMDYASSSPESIPESIKVTVIPVLNPDGLTKVVGTDAKFSPTQVSTSQTVLVSGRFNANNVDLSRNFDCDWKANSVWQKKSVSGGTAAFSEPESQAFKAYVEKNNPAGVVVWYSAAGGVYASSCGGAVLPQTTEMTNLYAKASGYPANKTFDFYETNGDIVNWLSKINTPAISVLLTNHKNTELEKNKKGMKAMLDYFNK